MAPFTFPLLNILAIFISSYLVILSANKSPYNDNKVTEESPAILTYYFDEGADMDYLVYYPRTDGGANGRFFF